MTKNFYLFVVALSVFLIGKCYAQEIVYVYDPGRIDAVTGENPDVQVMRLLEEQGYTVNRFPHPDLQTVGDEQLDSLNSAGLVFIGRAVGSANFQSPNKEVWHSITAPIITSNMWALRSNRMNWFASESCTNVDDPLDAVFYGYIMEEDEEIFAHMSGEIEWWTGPFSTIVVEDPGNAWILAVKADDNSPLLVRFDAGTEFYAGAGDTPEGERVYIGSASDNMLDEDGNNIFNYLGYTEQSKKIFLNEVARLLDVFVGVSDFEESYRVDIYPNPTVDRVTVEMKNLRTVEVLSVDGKRLALHQAQSDAEIIDVSSLNKGVYVLKVTDRKGVYTTRRITKN